MSNKKVYQLAIIGPKDEIIGFKALGAQTVPARSTEEMTKALYTLKDEKINPGTEEERPKYAIIFVNDFLYQDMHKDDYKKLTADPLPAIVPIPGSQGPSGYGLKRISKFVEQAVGSDILGN